MQFMSMKQTQHEIIIEQQAELLKDRKLLKRCLDVLNLEAEYSDHFKRPANKCPAWYELRAELIERLKV